MKNKNNDRDIFNKYGRRAGFTLIELLVVIAIIGILASVVVTNVSSAKEKANRAAALSTLSSIMPEMTMCAIDGGGTSGFWAGRPICTDGSVSPGVAVPGHDVLWPDILAKTGWNVIAFRVPMIDDGYSFGAKKNGQEDINCAVVNNSCK